MSRIRINHVQSCTNYSQNTAENNFYTTLPHEMRKVNVYNTCKYIVK